jgi:hypothetical protein
MNPTTRDKAQTVALVILIPVMTVVAFFYADNPFAIIGAGGCAAFIAAVLVLRILETKKPALQPRIKTAYKYAPAVALVFIIINAIGIIL